ncbi:MAG: hypothetical protein JNK15_10695 [Planctomycetes bacterium]|nr:hypothetical protein [Planctomycetota bacterium]
MRSVRLLVHAVCAATAVAQQPVWQFLSGPAASPPLIAQVGYDTRSQRSVAVGADATLVFDRARWITAGPGTGWQYSAVAFDQARGVLVAFGGSQFLTADAGTREWNGSGWTLRTPPNSPPGRARSAMAFDRARSRLVLFGGQDGLLQQLGDTWEFDGTTWTQATTTAGPAARTHHAMAWDPQRGVVVLYGGQSTAWTNETWEWNGTAWTQFSGGPTARPSVLAYDEQRSRLVLLATQPGGSTTASWERTGTTWAQVQAVAPIQQTQNGGTYDPVLGAVVANGLDFDLQPRTWRWTGTTWTTLTAEVLPPLVEGAALATCGQRQSLLRIGMGATSWLPNSATWEWVGGVWRIVPTPSNPPLGLAWTAMAGEPAGSTLLFGGVTAGVPQSSTWRFSGGTWQQLAPTTQPPARSQHALVADPVAGTVLLFGGLGPTGTPLGDTWRWDGANWTQLAPSLSPSARANAAMAFDAAAGVVRLFGGGPWNGTALADFWQWNGSTWQPVAAAGGPTARARAVMAFDPIRQRTVVTGGFTTSLFGSAAAAGTWEWDGTAWTAIGGTQPPAHVGTIGAFDDITGRVVVYTGQFGPVGMWHLGAASVAATTPYGGACAGSSGDPELAAFGLPRRGNPVFALHASSALPGAPTVFGLGPLPANVPLGGGCALLVAVPDLGFALADPAGVARLPLPLPANASLHGASFVAQAAALDPFGPFAQFALTAGLQVAID